MEIRSVEAPQWAAELYSNFASGACSQFILYGNVRDLMAVDGRLTTIERYIQDELLAGFEVVFSFDLGNGLALERGHERLMNWNPAVGHSLPQEAVTAIRLVSRYRRYLNNLAALGEEPNLQAAIIVRDADQLLPADGQGLEHGRLSSLVRDWATNSTHARLPFASLLIADNLNDLEPLIAFGSHSTLVRIPLPSEAELLAALGILQAQYPQAIPGGSDLKALAAAMAGVSINTLQQITKVRAHHGEALHLSDFAALKKEMVERDAPGMVEFLESHRTLAEYHGQDALKAWLRQDIVLWARNDLQALPMGYLLCGPIGTGKTFLVECLAGEARVPVLKIHNFRDKWIGSSEGNLEKILRLIRALGRCIVFIDEADQTLGRRESGPGDGGLSGRLYSMIAQEMSNTDNRGKVMWILATSRPDLIEQDLKRPGRVDLKVPILPTTTAAESTHLIAALARRYGVALSAEALQRLERQLPVLLTPGAAEVLVVKVYRMMHTENMSGEAALLKCLEAYQNPVPADVLEKQITLAVREATDLSFVPNTLRRFAVSDNAGATV